MLIKHKQKYGVDNITTIRISPEPQLHWKNPFQKNPLFFRIYAGFEADNEKDNSSISNETNNISISKVQYLLAITKNLNWKVF